MGQTGESFRCLALDEDLTGARRQVETVRDRERSDRIGTFRSPSSILRPTVGMGSEGLVFFFFCVIESLFFFCGSVAN